MNHANTCGCPTCMVHLQVPIWPGNSVNLMTYSRQNLFNRDNHNHSEVLHEKLYPLPLALPQNRTPFVFHNASDGGKLAIAPFSSDNAMHQDWVPFRMCNNRNTPTGSDSALFFGAGSDDFYEGTPAQAGFTEWKDWLDQVDNSKVNAASLDQKLVQSCRSAPTSSSCSSSAGGDKCGGQKTMGPQNQICEMTCMDWWTNRLVPPQGTLTRPNVALSGGCPYGTVKALTCHPCEVQQIYERGTSVPL
jgi:hypothetical protein